MLTGYGWRSAFLFASLALAVGVLACGREERPRAAVAEDRSATDRAQPSGRPRVVVLGDSLTAGYGLSRDLAFPALLERRLAEEGYDWEVVNAGVSGDTSAGGLSRLDWSLDGDVRILVVALGANDGLRGLPVETMKKNIGTIIERAQGRGIRVLLAGMEALSNMGPTYRREFHDAFPDLARRYRVAFVPFLLEGIAAVPSLNQGDGVHPTAEGQKRIADLVWPALQPLLPASPR